jgi:hypothetical protein
MSTAGAVGRPGPMRPDVRTVLGGAAVVAAFAVLAVFNSGGYRYGASDQAFYVPAIMRHVDTSLFPRDRVLIAVQDDLLLINSLLATIVLATGLSVAQVLFGAYLVMLLAVAAGGWLFGRAVLETRWAAVALVLAMSIRHRVPKTGVNTLEHYFHPRMVAFAFGTAGLATLVRGRTWVAFALAMGAGVVHPTTGIWFAIVVGGGALIAFPEQRRRWLLLASACALAAIAVLYSGALADRLVVMDAEWLHSLATKDYLFPNRWSASTWLQHALYVIVIAISLRARRRLALAGRGEHALIAGLLVMLVLFGAALPLVSAHIAVAVQLQISRALWIFDLVAVAYAALGSGRCRGRRAGPRNVRDVRRKGRRASGARGPRPRRVARRDGLAARPARGRARAGRPRPCLALRLERPYRRRQGRVSRGSERRRHRHVFAGRGDARLLAHPRRRRFHAAHARARPRPRGRVRPPLPRHGSDTAAATCVRERRVPDLQIEVDTPTAAQSGVPPFTPPVPAPCPTRAWGRPEDHDIDE